jgi:hypothetical protein
MNTWMKAMNCKIVTKPVDVQTSTFKQLFLDIEDLVNVHRNTVVRAVLLNEDSESLKAEL